GSIAAGGGALATPGEDRGVTSPAASPDPPMKQRADQLLVDRGLAESRTRAQGLILAGRVFAGEQRVDKPGTPLADATRLEVRGQDHPWVSRGGLKLDHGLRPFGLSPGGR